jgi:hypothetical protein
MLNHQKTGLLIFDAFQIDPALPKWNDRRKAHQKKLSSGDPAQIDEAIMETSDPMGGFSFGATTRFRGGTTISSFGVMPMAGVIVNGVDGSTSEKKSVGIFKKLFGKKNKTKINDPDLDLQFDPNFEVVPISDLNQKNLPDEVDVLEFFKSVKNSKKELVLVEQRLESFVDALEYLKKTGQKAMMENVFSEVEIHRAETQLFAAGFTKCITEDNAIEFAKKAPREVKLDWIQNFVRSIPEKITNEKVKLDEKHIFDNYVIMHYDPDDKGSEMTKAEKEKKKDPILFGVMLGSTKLYYIGDWIDEYCDLTFDKLVEVMGKKAISANDITAHVEIKK